MGRLLQREREFSQEERHREHSDRDRVVNARGKTGESKTAKRGRRRNYREK